MGLFGKVFGKKDNLDSSFDAPPDFSQPPGQGGDPLGADPLGSDPTNADLYGKDPLQNPDPFNPMDSGPGKTRDPLGPPGGGPSHFDNNLFSSNQPTNADHAREYARGLEGQPGQAATHHDAGAITGHEANLILERLDTIKAELDAIKQRTMRIERYIDTEERKQTQKRYF